MMTQHQFKKSIQNRELHLGFWDILTHYMIIVFIISIPIAYTWIRVKDGDSVDLDIESLTSILIPISVAILLYLWQKHKLKLTEVQSPLSSEKIKEILESTAVEQNWRIEQFTKNIFIATSQPGFNWRSFGERITVLLNGDIILINSICDPEKKSSISSGGMNKKNVDLLVSKLT